jgi:hypothetical protein
MRKQPFEQLLAFNMNNGQAEAEASFKVPAGKQTVIEFVTAILSAQAGQSAVVTFFVMTGGVAAPGIVHALALAHQGTFNGGDTFVASQLVRLYPDPGSTVIFQFVRNAVSGVASGNISLTGFVQG